MLLSLTAHTTSGPVIHTATVAGPEEALEEARRVLQEVMSPWTPEHEIGLRTAVQEAARSGQHTSGSLVVTLV